MTRGGEVGVPTGDAAEDELDPAAVAGGDGAAPHLLAYEKLFAANRADGEVLGHGGSVWVATRGFKRRTKFEEPRCK